MTIIAFTGAKGSGKSTATEVVTLMGARDVKMAAPLKRMLSELFRYAGYSEALIHRCLEGDLKEVPDNRVLLGATPRHAMQQLGTEWRNSIHQDLWINLWSKEVDKLLSQGINVTCSDIRFPHEVEALKARKTATYLVYVDRGLSFEAHESEQSLQHLADVTITNHGSIEEFTDKVMSLYNAVT